MSQAPVVEKFLQYVRIDTQSNEESITTPSTAKQFDLARLLATQLTELGCRDVEVTQHCLVYATVPPSAAFAGKASPTIALIAHLDTSPEASGANVNPQIHHYRGGDIRLCDDVVIPASQLASYVGQDIITSDGSTLLGADDKAGIAAIMQAVELMMKHPERHPHSTVRICFTPDEEVGRGTDNLDIAKLGVDLAYTCDGGKIGEIEDETFNAYAATVTVYGKNVHPGTAKGILVNAMKIGGEILAALPAERCPENTCEREGFLHPIHAGGDVEKFIIKLIIRDFSMDGIHRLTDELRGIVTATQGRHPTARIVLETREQYLNMRPLLDQTPEVTALALESIRACGITPIHQPIRGGTDGARLTFAGVPTPNLFAGGENFHSRSEFLPIPSLVKAVDVLLHLCESHARRGPPTKAK